MPPFGDEWQPIWINREIGEDMVDETAAFGASSSLLIHLGNWSAFRQEKEQKINPDWTERCEEKHPYL